MALPIVAIVGRPNVGKSSLGNAIARQRVSIVEPTAGTTRDRVSIVCELDEAFVELVDTGGHGVVDRDDLSEHVERQIRFAVEKAALILFLVDARDGLTPLDTATANLLRSERARVVLVANKVDEEHIGAEVGEFVRLGFGEPILVSAKSYLGLRELRDLIRERTASSGVAAVPQDLAIKIAILGRRNAGKSSFVNSLAGEERVIVSEVPGTTRDSIDVRIEKDGRTLLVIDTAGLKRKSKLEEGIEFYAYTRAVRSMERADVVLFMIDATEPVSQVDKKLGQLISEAYKPCVLVVNKWDLAKDRAVTGDYKEYLDKMLPELSYAPVSFTTAKTGKNAYSTIDLAAELFKQANTRVSTGTLNQALQAAVGAHSPPTVKGRKRAKFFYATQVDVAPPTIVAFVNDPERVPGSYERFLVNRLRQHLPFAEVPIRLVLRSRRETDGEAQTARRGAQ